ncbi:hypothetical protein HDU82_008361 [Entophlyctis luteolus]|nr:hypothetical protein HDU82_008361 [Entophlyctis luteolus]
MNVYLGTNLGMLVWTDALTAQAYTDASYSINADNCGSLVHLLDFGVALAKSLGWADFISAIRSFIEYDDGNGSECEQYLADPSITNHFRFIVDAGYSNVGCATVACSNGQSVVACDYN